MTGTWGAEGTAAGHSRPIPGHSGPAVLVPLGDGTLDPTLSGLPAALAVSEGRVLGIVSVFVTSVQWFCVFTPRPALRSQGRWPWPRTAQQGAFVAVSRERMTIERPRLCHLRVGFSASVPLKPLRLQGSVRDWV